MSIKIIAEFIREATVRTVAYVYDDDDASVDPTHSTTPITVTIADPTGEVVANAEAMAHKKDSEGADIPGTYEHYLYTDADYVKGWYEGVVTTMDGAGTTTKVSKASYGFQIN